MPYKAFGCVVYDTDSRSIKALHIPIILDLVEDRVRSRLYAVLLLLLVYMGTVWVVLFVPAIRDPQLSLSNQPSNIDVLSSTSLSSFFGSLLVPPISLTVTDGLGYPVQGCSVRLGVMDDDYNQLIDDAVMQGYVVDGIYPLQYQLFTPLLEGYTAVTDMFGVATFPQFKIISGRPTIYNLYATAYNEFGTYEASSIISLQMQTRVTKVEERTSWTDDDIISLPYRESYIQIGMSFSLNYSLCIQDEKGDPIIGALATLFVYPNYFDLAVNDDLSVVWVEDIRPFVSPPEPHYTVIINNFNTSDENGMVSFHNLAIESSTSLSGLQFALSVEGFIHPLYYHPLVRVWSPYPVTSLTVMWDGYTDNTIIMMTYVEGQPFMYQPKIRVFTGFRFLSGKSVYAFVSTEAGLSLPHYRRMSVLPKMFMRNDTSTSSSSSPSSSNNNGNNYSMMTEGMRMRMIGMSEPSDGQGYAHFYGLGFRSDGMAGIYGITFVCDGVKSKEIFLNVKTSVAHVTVTSVPLSLDPVDGLDPLPVVLVTDSSFGGIPAKLVQAHVTRSGEDTEVEITLNWMPTDSLGSARFGGPMLLTILPGVYNLTFECDGVYAKPIILTYTGTTSSSSLSLSSSKISGDDDHDGEDHDGVDDGLQGIPGGYCSSISVLGGMPSVLVAGIIPQLQPLLYAHDINGQPVEGVVISVAFTSYPSDLDYSRHRVISDFVELMYPVLGVTNSSGLFQFGLTPNTSLACTGAPQRQVTMMVSFFADVCLSSMNNVTLFSSVSSVSLSWDASSSVPVGGVTVPSIQPDLTYLGNVMTVVALPYPDINMDDVPSFYPELHFSPIPGMEIIDPTQLNNNNNNNDDDDDNPPFYFNDMGKLVDPIFVVCPDHVSLCPSTTDYVSKIPCIKQQQQQPLGNVLLCSFGNITFSKARQGPVRLQISVGGVYSQMQNIFIMPLPAGQENSNVAVGSLTVTSPPSQFGSMGVALSQQPAVLVRSSSGSPLSNVRVLAYLADETNFLSYPLWSKASSALALIEEDGRDLPFSALSDENGIARFEGLGFITGYGYDDDSNIEPDVHIYHMSFMYQPFYTNYSSTIFPLISTNSYPINVTDLIASINYTTPRTTITALGVGAISTALHVYTIDGNAIQNVLVNVSASSPRTPFTFFQQYYVTSSRSIYSLIISYPLELQVNALFGVYDLVDTYPVDVFGPYQVSFEVAESAPSCGFSITLTNTPTDIMFTANCVDEDLPCRVNVGSTSLPVSVIVTAEDASLPGIIVQTIILPSSIPSSPSSSSSSLSRLSSSSPSNNNNSTPSNNNAKLSRDSSMKATDGNGIVYFNLQFESGVSGVYYLRFLSGNVQSDVLRIEVFNEINSVFVYPGSVLESFYPSDMVIMYPRPRVALLDLDGHRVTDQEVTVRCPGLPAAYAFTYSIDTTDDNGGGDGGIYTFNIAWNPLTPAGNFTLIFSAYGVDSIPVNIALLSHAISDTSNLNTHEIQNYMILIAVACMPLLLGNNIAQPRWQLILSGVAVMVLAVFSMYYIVVFTFRYAIFPVFFGGVWMTQTVVLFIVGCATFGEFVRVCVTTLREQFQKRKADYHSYKLANYYGWVRRNLPIGSQRYFRETKRAALARDLQRLHRAADELEASRARARETAEAARKAKMSLWAWFAEEFVDWLRFCMHELGHAISSIIPRRRHHRHHHDSGPSKSGSMHDGNANVGDNYDNIDNGDEGDPSHHAEPHAHSALRGHRALKRISPAALKTYLKEAGGVFFFPQRLLLGLAFGMFSATTTMLLCILGSMWLQAYMQYVAVRYAAPLAELSQTLATNPILNATISGDQRAVDTYLKDLLSQYFLEDIVPESVLASLENALEPLSQLSFLLPILKSSTSIQHVMGRVHTSVLISTYAAAAFAALVTVVLWLSMLRRYKRRILMMRLGCYHFDKTKYAGLNAANYPGLQTIHSALGYVLLFLTAFAVGMMCQPELVPIVVENGMFLVKTVAWVIALKLVAKFIVSHFIIAQFTIRHRRLWAFFDFAWIFVNVVSILLLSAIRLVVGIFLTTLYFARMDESMADPSVEHVDPGYGSYVSMLMIDHMYNNPIFTVFTDMLIKRMKDARLHRKESLLSRSMRSREVSIKIPRLPSLNNSSSLNVTAGDETHTAPYHPTTVSDDHLTPTYVNSTPDHGDHVEEEEEEDGDDEKRGLLSSHRRSSTTATRTTSPGLHSSSSSLSGSSSSLLGNHMVSLPSIHIVEEDEQDYMPGPEAVRRCQMVFRWWLFVTLHNNPSIRKLRKEKKGASEHDDRNAHHDDS